MQRGSSDAILEEKAKVMRAGSEVAEAATGLTAPATDTATGGSDALRKRGP